MARLAGAAPVAGEPGLQLLAAHSTASAQAAGQSYPVRSCTGLSTTYYEADNSNSTNGGFMAHRVALALQGGGAHGAFTWGVLDRLLDEVGLGTLEISALSGSSAGSINAALCARGLGSESSPAAGALAAQALLKNFWTSLSERAFFGGNPLLGGLFANFFSGWNLDWSPTVIAQEMASLVLSPYDAPFYSNPLKPLLDDFLPPAALNAINDNPALGLHVCATNVQTNRRRVFTQPDISIDTLLASACLPSYFRAIQIDTHSYWDGGFIGNPALAPLLKGSQDIIAVTVNPLRIAAQPPRSAREILDRLNDITSNTPLVLEMNAIHAVNKLLSKLTAQQGAATGFKPVRLHLLGNDKLVESLGFAGKQNASAAFLTWLFDEGRKTAQDWWQKKHKDLGERSSCSWIDKAFSLEHDVIDRTLKGG